MGKPKTVFIKGRDIKPYHYGIWCSIGNGEPFTNNIDRVQWSEDGKRLLLLLDTHNCIGVGPDADVEVVPVEPSPYAAKQYGNWTLPPRPVEPLPSRASVIAYLRSLPAGGIAEMVAEAKVLEWRGRELFPVAKDQPWGWLFGIDPAFAGCLAGGPEECAEESAARSWVEQQAIAAGWTIAKPKENADV